LVREISELRRARNQVAAAPFEGVEIGPRLGLHREIGDDQQRIVGDAELSSLAAHDGFRQGKGSVRLALGR